MISKEGEKVPFKTAIKTSASAETWLTTVQNEMR
jgi:hypothetical protein